VNGFWDQMQSIEEHIATKFGGKIMILIIYGFISE
jgi:hypothetical protein